MSYNRFHDQLLLSAGSDGQVVLHSVASLSSAPHGETYGTTTDDDPSDLEPSPDRKQASDPKNPMAAAAAAAAAQPPRKDRRRSRTDKLADGVLSVFEQHEESVYSVVWSAADPWVLASLSYDGRVAVSMVSNEDKYKIIL